MKKVNVIVFFLLVLSASAFAAETKSPAVLLQQGIYAEETEGNLEKAMEIYSQIRSDYNDVERISAIATYQLGLCHLKKGQKDEAAEYFQQAATKYSSQKEIAYKAKKELGKIRPSTEEDLQSLMVKYLFDLHKNTYLQAKSMGIKSNTRVYIVDETFASIRAGLTAVENDSGKPIGGDIVLGNSDSNVAVEVYDENLNLQKCRYENSKQQIARYSWIWAPEKPLAQGEIRILGYRTILPEPLLKQQSGYELIMGNNFGPEVLENIVVVLPGHIEITEGTTDVNSHQKIGSYDLYVWQKRVPANTMNEKKITLMTRESYPDAVKPAVADSFPETYSNNVDPTLNKISVTFDQDMFPNGWSWCRTGEPDTYPQTTGTPLYKDKRTCILPVAVEAAKAYLIIINLPPYENFRNTDMTPAKPYAIVFATKDKAGNPTEIPADLLKKAQEINTKYAIPEPLLETIPAAVQKYISNKFLETYKSAMTKGLHTNSHVHIIDEDFYRNTGGIHIFENKTGAAIDKEIAMSSFDSPELYVFDDEGIRQKIRMIKIPASNYRMFWTPSRPVEPEEIRTLVWMGTGKNKLNSDGNQQYSLVMQNHFGAPVIEDFYVVMPSNIELKSQTENYTSRETIEGFDIYCWSKEQGTNVNHRVDITLAKKK